MAALIQDQRLFVLANRNDVFLSHENVAGYPRDRYCYLQADEAPFGEIVLLVNWSVAHILDEK